MNILKGAFFTIVIALGFFIIFYSQPDTSKEEYVGYQYSGGEIIGYYNIVKFGPEQGMTKITLDSGDVMYITGDIQIFPRSSTITIELGKEFDRISKRLEHLSIEEAFDEELDR